MTDQEGVRRCPGCRKKFRLDAQAEPKRGRKVNCLPCEIQRLFDEKRRQERERERRRGF
jgi:hypothetical protein